MPLTCKFCGRNSGVFCYKTGWFLKRKEAIECVSCGYNTEWYENNDQAAREWCRREHV